MKSFTLTKASLILLIAGSLIGCSTTVAVHEPMPCDGVPVHRVQFTDEEKASITESAVKKITEITAIYKARIRAQCKAVEIHNQEHSND